MTGEVKVIKLFHNEMKLSAREISREFLHKFYNCNSARNLADLKQ